MWKAPANAFRDEFTALSSFFWCGVNFVYLTKDKRKDKGHAKRLVNGLNKKKRSPFCDKAVVANLCYCYFAV